MVISFDGTCQIQSRSQLRLAMARRAEAKSQNALRISPAARGAAATPLPLTAAICALCVLDYHSSLALDRAETRIRFKRSSALALGPNADMAPAVAQLMSSTQSEARVSDSREKLRRTERSS
jgi:hypothetical protein